VSAEASNDVFISYRREVGGMVAMALHQHLTDHGLDAFYDVESLRAGQFDTVILNQIAARTYFLLVLTPGTLDRCHEPGDWLRREIEQAFATGRMIVPVHTPNFDFGDMERLLPDGLGSELQRFNGQELPQRWFKFAVQQLVDEFLVPIELANVATPAEDQPVVDRMQEEAQATIAVTETQLTAQEYLERGFARREEEPEEALADLDEAIRLAPGYAQAFNHRGFIRHSQGDLAGALADVEEAIRLEPEYAIAFNNRGFIRRSQGDPAGAIVDYDEAIRLEPKYAQAFDNRGLARYDEGDLLGARADFDEAIRFDPEYAWAFNNRGFLRHSLGDLAGALADVEEAIRLNPEYPEALNNRGFMRQSQGDLAEAIADYDEAIRLDPEYALAFYNRGTARRDQGDLEGAIADLEHGASLAPEDAGFPRLLAELKAHR
jgi:tetratricopeptide (TPR) repeat protein